MRDLADLERRGDGRAVRRRGLRVGVDRAIVGWSLVTSAPAVLWLHGSGPGVTALTNWQALITRLAPRFHNLAPDVLGFGDSAHPDPAPAGMGAFTALRAEVLLRLLDVLALQRVHVVGNSMGAIIALQMVLDAPERVDRLVLMGSGGAPSAPTPDLLR